MVKLYNIQQFSCIFYRTFLPVACPVICTLRHGIYTLYSAFSTSAGLLCLNCLSCTTDKLNKMRILPQDCIVSKAKFPAQ